MNSPEETGRGRDASWPSQIPRRGWRDVAWRVSRQVNSDRVALIAAGVSFYFLLALFPALAAFVAIFGVFSDPTAIVEQIDTLRGIVPADGLELIESQLVSLASQNRDALSLGFIIAFAFSFWSANNGTKSLFQALNIAYGEQEKRSFLHVNLLSFAFTLTFMATAMVLIALVGIAPAVLALLDLDWSSQILISVLRWPILLFVSGFAISALYRYGPSRNPAKWRWISWGGCLATGVWFVASLGLSYYLQNFADYNATYGSLGAVVGFLLWIWLSTVILIVGAEINAEMEHQTARDSTIGEPKPMGKRGAVVADTLGEAIVDKDE